MDPDVQIFLFACLLICGRGSLRVHFIHKIVSKQNFCSTDCLSTAFRQRGPGDWDPGGVHMFVRVSEVTSHTAATFALPAHKEVLFFLAICPKERILQLRSGFLLICNQSSGTKRAQDRSISSVHRGCWTFWLGFILCVDQMTCSFWR